MINKTATILSFLLAACLVIASHYDWFGWNVDLFGNITYVITGIILVPATALFFGILSTYLNKENRLVHFTKAFSLSMVAMIIPFATSYIHQQIMFADAVKEDYARNIEFFKSRGISEMQVVQDDPTVALSSKPIIIVNRATQFYKMDLKDTISAEMPLKVVALVRKDFIPEDSKLNVKLRGIKKNSVERITLYEGVLELINGTPLQDGYSQFSGIVTLNENANDSSLQWLVVEGRDKLSAVMEIHIKLEHSANTGEL